MSNDSVPEFVREAGQLQGDVLDMSLRPTLREVGGHWLIFNMNTHDVIGCHCGFAADVDTDCGYGDSVVKHLLEVGRR